MASSSLVQQSHSVFTAIASTRLHFVNSSLLRSSFLPVRSQSLTAQGSNTVLRLPTKPARRNASAAIRSGMMEGLTDKGEQKVKESLEFFVHEIRSADPNDETATLKLASLPPHTAPGKWGSSFVFDNEVREGLDPDTTLLGRERGWGVVADRNCEAGLQLTSKISFMEGKYKDSTLTFSGNVGGLEPSELIINGGTGQFRGARGYVLADSAPSLGPRFRFHWKVYIL